MSYSLSSDSGASSGLRLCLALRPAGLAFSSGFALVIGCPGGTEGFLMDAKRERDFRRLEDLGEVNLVTISTASRVKIKWTEYHLHAIAPTT